MSHSTDQNAEQWKKPDLNELEHEETAERLQGNKLDLNESLENDENSEQESKRDLNELVRTRLRECEQESKLE